MTLAAYGIPVSLAYASLAGLPPQYGTYCYLASARMLAKLHEAPKAQGIRLRLVSAHSAVRDLLRAEGLEETIGYFGRRISVADAVDEFQGREEIAPNY